MPKNTPALPPEIRGKVENWISPESRVLHWWKRQDIYFVICGYFADTHRFKLEFLRVWETPGGGVVISQDQQLNLKEV